MVNPRQVANILNRQHQQRAAHIKRINDQVAREHVIKGQFIVTGSGEFTAELNFPVRFYEKPVFTAGFELHPDAQVADGRFPTATAMVRDWNIEEKGHKKYFIGATIIGVTTDSPQRMFVNYRFEGKAITNPVQGGQTSESFI